MAAVEEKSLVAPDTTNAEVDVDSQRSKATEAATTEPSSHGSDKNTQEDVHEAIAVTIIMHC